MMEAGVLLDLWGQPIHWHEPPERSGGSLPDSRDLWDIIWENRKILAGFAHSHPGSGYPSPSYTDVTTFAAVEAALGRRLEWWICTSDSLALYRWAGPDRLTYGADGLLQSNDPDWAAWPDWIRELRRLSGYNLERKENES